MKGRFNELVSSCLTFDESRRANDGREGRKDGEMEKEKREDVRFVCCGMRILFILHAAREYIKGRICTLFVCARAVEM